MKILFSVLLLLLAQANLHAQEKNPKGNFTALIQREVGDLNNDKRDDVIVLEMDVEDDTRPLRVQIFLSQPNGKRQLVVSSTTIMESEYPAYKNGEHNGNPINRLPIFTCSFDLPLSNPGHREYTIGFTLYTRK